MDLNIEKVVFIIKIINLDTKVFTKKIIVSLIFKINNSNIYIIMTLINQNTIMLF